MTTLSTVPFSIERLARIGLHGAILLALLQTCLGSIIRLTESDIQQLDTVKEAIESASDFNLQGLSPWPSDLSALPKLITNSSEPLRWELTAIIAETAQGLARDNSIRPYLVSLLVKRLSDESLRIQQSTVSWLLPFHEDEFTESDIQATADSFTASPSSDGLILVGRLSYNSFAAYINELATPLFASEPSQRIFGTLNWSALLLQAREGDPASIEQLIRLLETQADEITRTSRLFEDLTLVRQPAIARYLQRYLMSDNRIESTKGSAPGMLIASFAAEALSKMLEGFPVKKAYSDYSPNEIQICRDWISAQNPLPLTAY